MGEDIQERLRLAVRADGRSQSSLGKAAGIPDGNMSRFMLRRGGVNFEHGVRLANVVGLSLDRTEGPGDE